VATREAHCLCAKL